MIWETKKGYGSRGFCTMATKNRQSPTNPNAVYAVMTAGAIAVLALVGWALYRSFNVPVSSTLATPSANTAVSPATSATVTAADDEAAKAALPRISAEELHQRIARNEITLIDVRTKDGWDSGHIGGAIHIPLASVESYLSYIPRDKPIVTY
ncbi:MAG TPA: rhodanese-like domain-containing protein, partial [Thermoanaerobaculia bacterium]